MGNIRQSIPGTKPDRLGGAVHIVLPTTLYIKAHTASTVDICATMCGGDGLVVPTPYCDKGQGHTSRFPEKKPGPRGYILPVLAYHKPRGHNLSNKKIF